MRLFSEADRAEAQYASSELDREKEDRKEAELACASYKRQLASLRDRCSEINAEIEQYRAIVSTLQRGAPHYLPICVVRS